MKLLLLTLHDYVHTVPGKFEYGVFKFTRIKSEIRVHAGKRMKRFAYILPLVIQNFSRPFSGATTLWTKLTNHKLERTELTQTRR